MNPATTPIKLGNVTAVPTGQTTQQQMSDAIKAGWTPSPVNTTLDAAKFGKVSPLPNANVTYSPSNFSVPPPTGTTFDANGNVTTTPVSAKDTLSKLSGLGQQLSTQGTVRSQLETDQQLQTKNDQAISDYNAYNKAKIDQANTIAQMQNSNPFGQGRDSRNSDIEQYKRNSDAHIANLAYQAQISQGAYESAQAIIKSKMDAQFQPIKDQIDFYSKIYPLESEGVKKELEDVTKTVDEINSLLMQNRAPVSVHDAVDKVISDYSSGKITAQEAKSKMAVAAGQYGVDKYKQAQISNMYSEIEQRKIDAAYKAAGGDQNKLEQQYRQVLLKPLSNRSGGLGLEDTKVSTANHLSSLMNQFKDANGNFKIPNTQYNELTLGLARLVSPNGQVGIELQRELTQKTAKGDIAGALTYLTGTPFTGSTQDVFKLLAESIDRQAQTAVSNRQQYMDYLQDLAPTDLDPERKNKLEQSMLPSYKPILTSQSATYITSPDGTKRVDMSKLTPTQLQEAKNAGWK